MSWLSDLLRVPSSSNPDKPEIKDEQYLDKNGRTFLNAYISFYERDLSADSLSNESSSFYMSSFYTVPTPKNEKHWELAHSLETYKGGLKTFVVDR